MFLKNWRPISLLNVDYKSIARVMSNRLKLVLPSIISPAQTCCVIGRDISDTIYSVRDIVDLVDKEQIEGYVLIIDQQKAFDRVNHAYLFKTLEKFGFGEEFINWIKVFYTNISSSVKFNGNLTKFFKITNSIRQGCPISAMLYVIAAEPLGQMILQCNVESLLLSRCWYTLMSQTIPDDTINEVKNMCVKFLWNGAHLIKYDTVIGKNKMVA